MPTAWCCPTGRCWWSAARPTCRSSPTPTPAGARTVDGNRDFTVLPAMAVPRNYHSGAAAARCARGVGRRPVRLRGRQTTCRSSPPYLFNLDSSDAVRPDRVGAGDAVLRQHRLVTTRRSRPSLVRLGATTHTVNDQRRVSLSFTPGAGNSYVIVVPSNPGILIPGKWMLFAMNANGFSVGGEDRASAATAPLDNPATSTSYWARACPSRSARRRLRARCPSARPACRQCGRQRPPARSAARRRAPAATWYATRRHARKRAPTC